METIHAEEGYPLCLRSTYLAMILGSVDSRQYRKLFVQTPSGASDVIEDGDLACAFFTSAILHSFGLIKCGVHTTVDYTINDLVLSGWKNITRLHIGAVVVWKPKFCTDDKYHRHIGFYVGRGKAVSTNPIARTPVLHPTTYNGTREIESLYFHPRLKAS